MDPTHEGKLVHFTGRLTSTSTVADDLFLCEAPSHTQLPSGLHAITAALCGQEESKGAEVGNLYMSRKVERFLWTESSTSSTEVSTACDQAAA